MAEERGNAWWSELRQNGMLISPTVLDEFMPGPAEFGERDYEKLRDAYTAFMAWSHKKVEKDNTGLFQWVDSVLEDFLKYDPRYWQKGKNVDDKYKVRAVTGEKLYPNRVLLTLGLRKKARILVRIDTTSARVGMGRGRTEYAKFLELLRATGVNLGILTNGSQFRLVYAGIDYDCWAEWETERWFEDTAGMGQLGGFKAVCGHWGSDRRDGVDFPLLQAIQHSRTKQGELSQVLGEQTRKAVEELLLSLDKSARSHEGLMDCLKKDPTTGKKISDAEELDALYQASIRIIMRIVVAFFAEAREMLPRGAEIYHSSYGVEGLFGQLQRAATAEGEAALGEHFHSWPRLLSLCRLIHEGSAYPELSIKGYGGALFKRGDSDSENAVLRALAVYEDPNMEVSDHTVYLILRLLKIGKVKTKIGRSTRWVSGPVDFSGLRTEYIGMMYEGLLDYHLRRVTPEQEAVIFLNIGKQPALPFSLLRSLDEKHQKDLLTKLGKEKTSAPAPDESEDNADEEEEPAEEGDEAEDEEVEEEGEVEISGDERTVAEITTWAENAVELAKLVKKPKGGVKNKFRYEQEKKEKARKIIGRIVLPGQMYLIRGSGTRKGTGTFYTKPQLAVPTVHRTLEPLVYNVQKEGDEELLTPKKPEEILSVKVCDPAMGSGSFLVGALRYLTDALYDSLWHHDRIRERSEGGTVITLPIGTAAEGRIDEELIPCRPDEDTFERRVKARLKRYVVERCIYGVDLNSLAVELAKLSLWVETMDRELPFGFLDHKLKAGNSLVGCWFDRFQEYPLMAWKREGGDKNHNPAHFEKSAWTKRIKKLLNEKVKPELVEIIQGQTKIEDYEYGDEVKVQEIHDRAVKLFEELHNLPLYGDGFADREKFFRENITNDKKLKRLKEVFDLWCAVWFWPGDQLDQDCPTPKNFYEPSEELMRRCRELARELKFFHWEIEFPDVFVSGRGGFDTVVGNPPWETLQPVSKEFFTIHDPIYRTYGKQVALKKQKELFENNREIERDWLVYISTFKAYSNWMKESAFPFGDPADEERGGNKQSLLRGNANMEVHRSWRIKRNRHTGYADSERPYRYQGRGKSYTYKMFLEHAHSLCRKGGRIGFIVPSGVYTDHGSTELRELFINRCKWEWLFGFENKRAIFDIHRSFKFCPVIVEKGGATDEIRTAFMRHELGDWEAGKPEVIPYRKEQIDKFSPNSKAILEIRSNRDLEILEKIYSNSVLLGDQSEDGWQIQYAQGDFNMTSDSHLFPPRTWWEEKGYKPDEYGRWLPPEGEKPELVYRGREIGPPGDVALPLYEGRMIGQFDFSQKGWVSGKGRSAVWRDIPLERKMIEPQYLMSRATTIEQMGMDYRRLKICFMDVCSSTNQRTMYAAVKNRVPAGHSAPTYSVKTNDNNDVLSFVGIINSFIFDSILRVSVGGLHLTLNYLNDSCTPKLNKNSKDIISLLSARMVLIHSTFSPEWLNMKNHFIKTQIPDNKVESLWAITPHERLRLRCILDAIVAEFYGLDFSDFTWILKQCHYPQEKYSDRSFTPKLDPKGFWRVDKTKPPELRHTTLSLAAFRDLKRTIEECGGNRDDGRKKFCEQNDGDGWMLPESISFSVKEDGTIDFDGPEVKEYVVRSKMGERFLPWQLEGTPEESWKECEYHARQILGEEGFEEFMREIEGGGVDNGGEVVGGEDEGDDGGGGEGEGIRMVDDRRKKRQRRLFEF